MSSQARQLPAEKWRALAVAVGIWTIVFVHGLWTSAFNYGAPMG